MFSQNCWFYGFDDQLLIATPRAKLLFPYHGTCLDSGVRGACAVLAAVAVLAGSSSPFVPTLQSWHPEHPVLEGRLRPGTHGQMCMEACSLFSNLPFQVHKEVIPAHTVYALNIERIVMKLWHPNHEELQQDKIHRQRLATKEGLLLC